jgi:toluene-4-monooxygenase system protein B
VLVPLYGFLEGDVLGLMVLVHDDEPVGEIAARLMQAASVRLPPKTEAVVYAKGRALDPTLTVARAGLRALDRVDVVGART